MNDQELLQMANMLRPSEIWQKAFKLYNLDKTNRPLHMGCSSCFNKVLVYHLKKRFEL